MCKLYIERHCVRACVRASSLGLNARRVHDSQLRSDHQTGKMFKILFYVFLSSLGYYLTVYDYSDELFCFVFSREENIC